MKYYVYSGYECPDSCHYTLKSFDDIDEALKFKLEFEEELYDECKDPVFRIIEGEELTLQSKQTVTEWEIKK